MRVYECVSAAKINKRASRKDLLPVSQLSLDATANQILGMFTTRVTRKIRYGVVGLQFQTMLKRLLLCAVFCDIFAQNLQPVFAAIRPLDSDAHTIYYNNQAPNERGDFHYEFQTSNGITTKAAGNEFGQSGVVQYISAEGIPITMTYVADVDGYHPTGDHIPKLPEQVLATLMQHKAQQQTVDEKINIKTAVRRTQTSTK